MSSGVFLHFLSDKSLRWTFRSAGLLLLLKNGVPKVCLEFHSGDAILVENELKKYWTLYGPSSLDEYKIIGFPEFVNVAQKFLERAQRSVTKVVSRDSDFEVIYDSSCKKIRVTRAQPISVDSKKKISVLIVDDSATIRQILAKVFLTDPHIEVIGSLANPLEVDSFIQKKKPDVMTLDIHMPEMDGVTLLKKLIPKYQIPTIMISSISKEEGPQVLEALAAGAIDYIQKPSFKDIDQVGRAIVESVKLAAQAKVRLVQSESKVKVRTRQLSSDAVVLIGSSTGGTEALRVIFESLPKEIPPILVVQHIPAVFSKALADRLNTLCEFEVKEAEENDVVRRNQVLIAPGGKQLSVVRRAGELRVRLSDDAPVNRHKPSVDYLFDQVSSLECSQVVGIVLTGMGADGARGLKKLFDLGARTIAQDQSSSVVWGMPREAVAMGGAEFVLPLDQIAEKLMNLAQAEQAQRPAALKKKTS